MVRKITRPGFRGGWFMLVGLPYSSVSAKAASQSKAGINARAHGDRPTSAESSADFGPAQGDRSWIGQARKKARRSEPFKLPELSFQQETHSHSIINGWAKLLNRKGSRKLALGHTMSDTMSGEVRF
jgi:hypothetical protein